MVLTRARAARPRCMRCSRIAAACSTELATAAFLRAPSLETADRLAGEDADAGMEGSATEGSSATEASAGFEGLSRE
jgi:succinate dehydrogenase/fumarate reductase-like Fe-S protein